MTNESVVREKRQSDLDSYQRIIKLETNFEHITNSVDSIAEKIENQNINTSRSFDALKEQIHKSIMASELQAQTNKYVADCLIELANAVSKISETSKKISSLEEFRQRSEDHERTCTERHKTSETAIYELKSRVDKIYTIVVPVWSLILMAIPIAWKHIWGQ